MPLNLLAHITQQFPLLAVGRAIVQRRANEVAVDPRGVTQAQNSAPGKYVGERRGGAERVQTQEDIVEREVRGGGDEDPRGGGRGRRRWAEEKLENQLDEGVCLASLSSSLLERCICGRSENTHAWRTMDAGDLFCSETKLNCLFLTRVKVLSKPLDLPRGRSGIVCHLSDGRGDLPSPRRLLDTKQGVDEGQIGGGRGRSGIARQNEST